MVLSPDAVVGSGISRGHPLRRANQAVAPVGFLAAPLHATSPVKRVQYVDFSNEKRKQEAITKIVGVVWCLEGRHTILVLDPFS